MRTPADRPAGSPTAISIATREGGNKMHSIRTTITAITIVAILTSILSVFAASFLIVQNETDRNSVGMMNLIDQDTQKSLEKYFESIEQSVEIAANIAIEDLDSVFLVECGAIRVGSEASVQTDEQVAALDAYLDEYCRKIQEFFSGVADYTQGVSAYYYCINPEISQGERGFLYMKVGKTGFIEQPPIDVQHLMPLDTLHTTWYEAAVSLGRPAWIGPYSSASQQGIWICSYFVPIYKAGMLVGLMGMDIPCDTLVAQVEDIRVYDTGFVCLMDADGRVIYHPDLSIGSSLNELGLSIYSEILQHDDSEDELIRYTANGEARQMSFSTLSNGMKLAVVAPAGEINAPWIRLIRAILIISGVVIALYVVLLLFIMGAITFPLKQLTAASQRLADADYDVDLNYRGKNEIGTLTDSFKRMRDQIRRYVDDLNHQIYHDRLTDLPNMRHFFNLAEQERDKMLEQDGKPVMLYFDIVGLGYYNRHYGFERGDRLIVDFAGILSQQFGDHRVCRFSGGRFAAVSDEDRVEAELETIIQKCQTAMDGTRLPIRVGVYPNRLERVDVNIACDRAKYACDQIRGETGSSIIFFDEKMLKTGEIYRYIINNLDRALAEGWVRVYYQPIIRAADGKICDEEALARWIDPVFGFLSPGDFIPALEQSSLIYKLDLYVLDQVLEKMKQQAAAGFYLVPQSINLSRMDFESCDVVEEIRRRVDEAGIDRSMITVEITESVIGGDFDFMKEQVARFQKLGFPVWMDDFGSGYSSLDVLQQIHFDLIKFDMRFMERFNEGDESKIILTELMNMAIGLGMETVCEGVEQPEQVEFLREIGCTRIQGYYFGKPLPFEGILKLFENGTSLEFENPEETEYYASIGRINLYDMTALANEHDESLNQYFNTLPMCIMEVRDDKVRFNRCNRSYRDFIQRTLGVEYDTEDIDCSELSGRPGAAFLRAVVQCSKAGSRTIIDEKINEDTVIHALIRRVAINPVTGMSAVAVAVLAVSRESEGAGTSYSQIAKALAADYVDLYYVNLETERFIEYSPDPGLEDLAMERHGEDFFAASRREARLRLYQDDQEDFVNTFTRQNVVRALDTQGMFKATYRLMIDGKPTYVDLKAVRMPGDPTHIIVGMSDVDAQMRQKEAMSRIQTEKTVYSRVRALTQGFICIYVVDPATGHYMEYSASSDYAGLGVPTEGEDFFAQSRKESARLIYPEDLAKFQTLLTRENILRKLEKEELYAFNYRLLLNGEPRYMSLKAALVEEQDGPVLIIGVNNIDAQVKHEQDYERQLSSARSKANLDVLTGVKNRTAYDSMSQTLARQIEGGETVRYAIVICRVYGLGWVNEERGRAAGNQLIRDACAVICHTFKHSPVFRVAGDRFAAIAEGHDYEHIDELVASLEEHNRVNRVSGGVVVACGMAKYDGTGSVASVFERAEALCTGE